MKIILLNLLVSIAFFGIASSQSFDWNHSLYADIKAHQVGDVITVLIIESANASRESNVKNSSKTDVGAESSISGNLTSFLPLFGAASSLSNSIDDKDNTEQKDQLTGKMSATIVDKTENGMFKIKGKRVLAVNGEDNVLKIEGLVRPRDIKSDNTVCSYNIANVKIAYRKGGIKNVLIQPGTIKRWSAVLISFAVFGLAFSGGL